MAPAGLADEVLGGLGRLQKDAGIIQGHDLVGVAVENEQVVEGRCLVPKIEEKILFEKGEGQGRAVVCGILGDVFNGPAHHGGGAEDGSADLNIFFFQIFPHIDAGGASHGGAEKSHLV